MNPAVIVETHASIILVVLEQYHHIPQGSYHQACMLTPGFAHVVDKTRAHLFGIPDGHQHDCSKLVDISGAGFGNGRRLHPNHTAVGMLAVLVASSLEKRPSTDVP